MNGNGAVLRGFARIFEKITIEKEESAMNTAAPDILNLANYSDLHAPAAEWFSSQWHVPTDAYRASMADGLHAAGGVPA